MLAALLSGQRLPWCALVCVGGPCHKPMCESMGPFYYSCPLGYLELVPVADEQWRECVRSYHAKRRKKREVVNA